MISRRRTDALLVALLAVAGVAPVRAQSRSLLSLLPTEGRALEVGGEHAGALSASDYQSHDDQYLEAWVLQARAGQTVTIDLASEAFDARLYVVGPGLSETLYDDDSGGGCNSRITLTALDTGSFHVVASSLGTREAGTYTLRVSTDPSAPLDYGCGEVDPAALAALPTDGRVVRMGDATTSQLGPLSPTVQNGRPAEAWTLEGRAGERLAVVMESSALDSYLYVAGPGLPEVLTDDDSGGDLNARIELTLPSAGPYTVVASALSEGSSGVYTLLVTEPLDLNELPTMGRVITVGESRSGQLTQSDPVVLDGRRGQVWAFEGTAGQAISIELVSADFDSYLYFFGPGIEEPLSNDDGAGDLNSRILATLTEDGTYRIIASSLGSNASGSYTLRVSAR